jgi:hypothetical protein
MRLFRSLGFFGLVVLFALGFCLLSTPGYSGGAGFVKILSGTNSQILAIDGSGNVTWHHDTGTGQYSALFSRDLVAGDWTIVAGGAVTGEVQTLSVPVADIDSLYAIAGQLLFSTNPLPSHPVNLYDTNWITLSSGWTDVDGHFQFGFFTNGNYRVGPPDYGNYLNIARSVTVQGSNVTDVVVHVSQALTITNPVDYELVKVASPLIQWDDPANCDYYSIAIYREDPWEKLEEGSPAAPSYQVVSVLTNDQYSVQLYGYDGDGNQIGRGSRTFTVDLTPAPTNADFQGYLYWNDPPVRITNHPVQLRAADGWPGTLISEQLTDANGNYLFPDIPVGEYQLVIPQHGEYIAMNYTYTVDADPTMLNVYLPKTITVSSPVWNETVASHTVQFSWSAMAGGTDHYGLTIYDTSYNTVDSFSSTTTSKTRDIDNNGTYYVEISAVNADFLVLGQGRSRFTVAAP